MGILEHIVAYFFAMEIKKVLDRKARVSKWKHFGISYGAIFLGEMIGVTLAILTDAPVELMFVLAIAGIGICCFVAYTLVERLDPLEKEPENIYIDPSSLKNK